MGDARAFMRGVRGPVAPDDNRPPVNAAERSALRTMRREARAAGALLANRGRGGLSPSLVLGVMRRDGFTCKVHGDKGEGDNRDEGDDASRDHTTPPRACLDGGRARLAETRRSAHRSPYRA